MSHYKPYPDYEDSGIEWLGKVPAHWGVQPLMGKFTQVKSSNKGIVCNNLLSLSYGKIVRKNIDKAEGLTPASYETYNIVKKGDIVLRLTDLQNDKRSLRTGLVGEEEGIITSAYLTIRPNAGYLSEYMHYLLYSYDVIKVFYSMGGGMRQSLTFWDMKRLPLLVPPKHEIKTIVEVLKNETSRIDALVNKKKRFIELLKARRQALITQAITKGLDTDVPMQDSGVEWLGEVPKHWKVAKLKHLAKVGNGSTPSRSESDYWEGGKFPWLNSSCVNLDYVDSALAFVTEKALDECHLPIIEPPAVLVGITGQGKTRGMATILRIKSTINQHIAYLNNNPSKIHIDYLKKVIDSAYQWLRLDSEGSGSTKGAITCEQLGNLSIPLPSLDTQKQITNYLDNQLKRLDVLTNNTQRSIDLLKERRAALITAAVTGKIDLRSEVESKHSMEVA